MGAFKSLFVILLTVSVVPASEVPADSASALVKSGLTDQLRSVCAEDTALFCSYVDHSSSESRLKCLIEYENILSGKCASYIRSMSEGACNEDTQEFCSHIQTNGGLDQCIQAHFLELSPQCQWNVMRRENRHTREKETERRATRFSKAVTGLCGVYLLIPFALALWAMLEIYTLSRKQAHFRKHSSHTEHSLSPQEKRNATWSIEFHDLSYLTDTPPTCLLRSNNDNRSSRRVLHKVSGLVHGAEMTVIMGPSGSGKGSLLRVLSGRAFSGELAGLRAINERAAFPREYDRVIRRQSFVPCGAARSDLLTPGLSVWQILLHAALLRLPDTLTINQIMHQAWEVLVFMELEPVADTVLSEEELRHNARQLTELQVKCLQVAVTLLGRPEAIFLEQPASSLSGADSVKLLKLLKKICRVYSAAIVLTLEQPTTQEYAVIDNVLALGPMGQMLHSGSSAAASSFFSSLADTTELAEFTLTDNDAATPGDILFDILHQCGGSRGSPQSSPTEGSPYDVLPEAEAEREGLLSAVDPHFVQVDVLDGDVEMQDMRGDSNNASPLHGTSRLQRAMTFIHQWFVVSEEYFFLQDRRAMLLGEERPSAHAALSRIPFQSSDHNRAVQDEPNDTNSARESAEPVRSRKKVLTAAPLTQVWVLLSSRLQVWSRDLNTIVLLTFQVFVAPLIICLAVGEVARTELERPKQAAGVLGWISVNALLLQCFLIVPSYFAERPVLDMRAGANSVNEWAHTVSTAVSDLMVAILVCTVTLSFAYVIHPLNPNTANIAFAFVCFIVGTCAWQAFIRLCAELTGSKKMTIGVVALALCFGLYVNGVVTNAPHLSPYLSFTPYLSVSSVLSRALVANDLHCCYLSTTCAALAKEAARDALTTTAESFSCPVSVQFTGDGTDEGNLGRWYLQMIQLDEDSPHILLFALFWANVIFRVATVFCIQRKNKSSLKSAATK